MESLTHNQEELNDFSDINDEININNKEIQSAELYDEELSNEQITNELEVQKVNIQNKEIPAETIEIIPNKNILNHLKSQEKKLWRFTFKNESINNKLLKLFEEIPEYNLTATYNTALDSPDITIQQDGITVGKINLMLCDRPNITNKSKHYCKIFFFQFRNPELYNAVKDKIIPFFESFESRKQSNEIQKSNNKNKKQNKNKTIKRKNKVNNKPKRNRTNRHKNRK
jgi:hypothetical protein